MTSIFEMIKNAQMNHSELYKLIVKFNPLLKKYARCLKYEDAYDELQLKFIELIVKLNLSEFRKQYDYVIIAYIDRTIRNYYIHLLKHNIDYKKNNVFFSEMSESEMNSFDISTAALDNYNFFDCFIFKDLTAHEFEIIFLYFFKGYSIAMISESKNVSRQAINQSKARALNKIKKHLL